MPILLISPGPRAFRRRGFKVDEFEFDGELELSQVAEARELGCRAFLHALLGHFGLPLDGEPASPRRH
jgi:hypothetical protein